MKTIRKGIPEFTIVDGVSYETLPLEFVDRGRTYVQLERKENMALYECYDEHGRADCWEIIKVRLSKESSSVIGGVEVQFRAKETYPSDEGFGPYGKCFTNKDRALKYWNEARKIIAVPES